MSVAPVTDDRYRRGPRLAGLLLAGALAAVAVLFGGGVASAHAYLRGSDPVDGSTVQGLPATVSLDFNETIHNFEPVVVVTGPDGKNHAAGAVQVVGNVVSTAVSTDGPPGSYAVAYRVVSADGHPVTGELHFTVTAPAAGSSAPSSSSPAPPTSNRASSWAAASTSTPSSTSRSSTAGSATAGSATAGSATAGSATAGSATAGSATAGGSTIGSASGGSVASSSSAAGSTPASTSNSGSSTPVEQSAGSPVQQTSSGPDWWIWLAIAVAAVILITAGVITLRRPHED